MKSHTPKVVFSVFLALFGITACTETAPKTCDYEKGDIITFGHYEQDNDTSNGKEPITWRVLDKNDKKQCLIISEKVLEVKSYNLTAIPVTWERSTIRSWLNGYGNTQNNEIMDFFDDNFIHTAFTNDEIAQIVTTTVPAHANPTCNISPTNETKDKIFLLSIAEAQNYFTSDQDRQADATPYCVQKGAYVQGTDTGAFTSTGTCTETHCYSYWWLRTQACNHNFASEVYIQGEILYVGNPVYDPGIGVRPALWTTL